MPEEAARRVREGLVFRTVAASSVLARQGQPADKLIIPVSASLRLVTRTDQGTITTHLRARRSLNLRQVLKGGPWEYSAFADAQVHIVELDANTFRTILEEDAPLYARYLERITGRLSVRLAAQALRHGGLLPVAAQRVLSLFEERSVAPGEVIELGNETPWVLVDRGSIAMLHDDDGSTVEVSRLSPGEFYGGA